MVLPGSIGHPHNKTKIAHDLFVKSSDNNYSPKTQFDIDFENGISMEQARENIMAFIDKLYQK